MNLKQMAWGAGLVLWAFACLVWVPVIWAIIGTVVLLLLLGVVVYFFWTQTALEMFVFGCVLWWLVVLANYLGTTSQVIHLLNLSSFGVNEHILGMLLTGLTVLVAWKIGESQHAQMSPGHFKYGYLEGLRKS